MVAEKGYSVVAEKGYSVVARKGYSVVPPDERSDTRKSQRGVAWSQKRVLYGVASAKNAV